jgi:hypothetical protein
MRSLAQTIMDTHDSVEHGKRMEAIHLAAQLMADAFRCYMGIPPQRLNDLDDLTRIFYLQTARNVIGKYEAVMYDVEPVVGLRVIDGGKAGE